MPTARKAPPAKKRTRAQTALRVGQTVTFRIGREIWRGRVVETLGGRGGNRKQLLLIATTPKRRDEEPVRFSLPADLVHAQ